MACPAGLNGVEYLAGGALHIENCDIFGFGQNGILASTNQAGATLFVNDTFLQHNGNGVQIAPAGGNLRSMLNRVRANGNSGFGFYLHPGSAGAGTSITDSTSSQPFGPGSIKLIRQARFTRWRRHRKRSKLVVTIWRPG